jgi:hypothetical protein
MTGARLRQRVVAQYRRSSASSEKQRDPRAVSWRHHVGDVALDRSVVAPRVAARVRVDDEAKPVAVDELAGRDRREAAHLGHQVRLEEPTAERGAKEPDEIGCSS